MINNPKVSIIIPCFNNSKTIIESINSVVNQNYRELEIIIVNDGSTDESEEIIEKYISLNDKRLINLINQNNQGPSAARNNGAKIANGKYLLFLDGDDKIDINYLTKCINIFEENKNLSIVYTKSEYFGAKKGSWKLLDFKIERFLVQNIIPITALIKKIDFDECLGFDENLKFAEDWDLWIKIIKRNDNVFKIKEPLFFYRKDETKKSITDTIKQDEIEKSYLYIYDKHYAFYRENNLDLMTLLGNSKYRKKYYNLWFKKVFYFFKKT
jgi:glycosyltransferase involved in cell wall biosynthesis